MTRIQFLVVLMAACLASGPLPADENEPVLREPDPLRPSQPQEWQTVGAFLSEGKPGRPNPLSQYAEEYFALYLAEQPSQHASAELVQAVNMWSYVDGGSLKIRESVEKVPADEAPEVWRAIGYAISRSFRHDQIEDQADTLLEQLSERVQSQEGRTALHEQLASLRFSRGDSGRAREVLELLFPKGKPASSSSYFQWMLRQVTDHPIGSPAPTFEVTDVDGRVLSLSQLRGKVVVLFFWGTWCRWCKPEYPYLRALAHQFGQEDLAIISISYDDDEAVLRRVIDEEGFLWFNISESKAASPVVKMYDVDSWPTTFVLDREGKYAAHNLKQMRLYTFVSQLIQKRMGAPNSSGLPSGQP